MFGRGNHAKTEKEKNNPDGLDMKSVERKSATKGGNRLSVVPRHSSNDEGAFFNGKIELNRGPNRKEAS